MDARKAVHRLNAGRLFVSIAAAIVFVSLALVSPAVIAQSTDFITGASPMDGTSQLSGEHHWGGHVCTEGETCDHKTNFMARWADELQLTAQQRSDIQIIMADYAERFRDLGQLGRDTAKGLLEMSPDDPSYYSRTQEASALAATSAAELVTLLAEMRGKLYAVLTPDQRQQLEDLRQKHNADKAAEESAD